ncbi:hypothetical protein J8M20_15170 [Pseudoalteromonas luteoviolacea]|uniref:ORC-CDC6 family AAA ATPase n=1 Tax=Pseudoalteromonas luteoviolacea TaxID=43657 RepID=UPI001B37F367|nr:hypothetical protein [Pseudoalteromonas luteoviolacea]MBQ4812699.1 hypothetical protein [Pseudoalteromonas luteoviolacea]
MQLIDIINKLSTARMEYQTTNGSVLNKFVVPFFIDKLDLRNISHSVALVGSRGSGKSTYIQHFSHSTRFDKSRTEIEERELECILLYWKPDIAYCQGLKVNWLGENASLFFSLHASLSLIDELAKFISNVGYHFPCISESINTKGTFWRAISRVTREHIDSVENLQSWVLDYKYELSTRLNPVNVDGLLSIEPKQMLDYLLKSLKLDCEILADTTFKVFVDEFELLTVEQQKVINTYRKESNSQLNWNVAYKLNAKPTNETTSDQWLQSPDDYTEENLDSFIESDYKIFAAEIFVLALQNAGLKCLEAELTPEFLGDKSNIELRKSKDYQSKVLTVVNGILPTPQIKELSKICIANTGVKNKVYKFLESVNLSNELISKVMESPSLAITIWGTHRQKSFEIKSFLDYLNGNLSRHEEKKVRDKISTFEFNTLLSLNLQNASVQVPVYAGFERFITMTTPNIRHFKELCLSALKASESIENETYFEYVEDIIGRITAGDMHQGVITTSSDLVKEVISYPPYGNKLSKLVNRVGELFRISQKSSYQSEPERDIFTIKYDYAGSDTELEDFLYSALSWRVLVEDDSRRIKDDKQITGKEFQLNPVYSPRFGISYRKKRGITLTVEQFKTLIVGSSDDFELMRKQYQQKWKADEENIQGILL